MKLDTVFLDKRNNKQLIVDFSGLDISSSLEANNVSTNSAPKENTNFKSSNTGYLSNAYKTINRKNKYGRLSNFQSNKVNPDEVKNYLTSKGYSKTAIAGLMSNIEGESGFNSTAVGDNGNAFGFFQHNGVRKDALLDYLSERGLQRSDWKGQIDFMEQEILPEFKRKMNNTKTPQEAADIFTRGYEKPANVNKDALNRANASIKYFKFGGVIKKDMGGYITSGGYVNTYEQPNVGGSIIGGVLSGAGTGLSLTGGNWIGAAAGAVIGGISGAIKGGRKRKQYEEGMRRQNRDMNRYMQNQSNSILAMYQPQGQAGQFGYYKFGGKIPKYALGTQIDNPEYEAEKGEVVQGLDTILEQSEQLASDIQLVEGNTHEEGGTLGTGGERVFTDRLNIAPELNNLLVKSGLKIKDKNPTYATIAMEIGKLKGKFEEKVSTNDYIEKNTGNVMLGKMNNLLDLTFSIQEADKESKGINNEPNNNGEIQENYYKFGGRIPKYANGGSMLSNSDVNWNMWDQQNSGFKNLNNFNSYVGLGLSTASMINNMITANRMNTRVPVLQQNAPAYLYNDRSGYLRSQNRAAYRNFVNNPLTQGSVSNQLAFADVIKQDNAIAQNENLRRDQYDLNYQNTSRQNDSANLERMRIAGLQSQQLQNQQNELRGSAWNDYIQNLNTVVKESEIRARDQQGLNIDRETLKAQLGVTGNNSVNNRFSTINVNPINRNIRTYLPISERIKKLPDINYNR